MEKFTYRVAETQSQDRHEQEMKKQRWNGEQVPRVRHEEECDMLNFFAL